VNVVTVVAYPKTPVEATKVAAQQFRWNLRNGKTSWAQTFKKGTTISLVNS